jgi:hypothetical protein
MLRGLEADETGLESISMAGFGVSDAEFLGVILIS